MVSCPYWFLSPNHPSQAKGLPPIRVFAVEVAELVRRNGRTTRSEIRLTPQKFDNLMQLISEPYATMIHVCGHPSSPGKHLCLSKLRNTSAGAGPHQSGFRILHKRLMSEVSTLQGNVETSPSRHEQMVQACAIACLKKSQRSVTHCKPVVDAGPLFMLRCDRIPVMLTLIATIAVLTLPLFVPSTNKGF